MECVTERVLSGLRRELETLLPQPLASGSVVQPSLNMAEGQKGKHSLTIEQWTDLFFTCVAIITADHPEHAPALMKYGHSIREMAARGMSWMFYDDEFRRLNNGNPATPCGELNTPLYLRAYKTNTDKSVPANRPFLPKFGSPTTSRNVLGD